MLPELLRTTVLFLGPSMRRRMVCITFINVAASQRFYNMENRKSHIPDNIGVIELFELFQQGNFSKNGHRNAVLR